MTGYGVPSPAPPPARSGPALPIFDLVTAGLGLVAFIVAFLPWVGLDCSGSAGCDRADYSGWDLASGAAGTALLIVAALLVVRRLFDSTADRASALPAVFAVTGALLIIVQLISGSPLASLLATAGGSTARKIGMFLALVVALAQAAVAVVSWLQASGRVSRPAGPAGAQLWDRQPGQHSAQPSQFNQPGQPQPQPQPGPDAGWPQHQQQQGYPAQPAQPAQQAQQGYGQPAPSYGQPQQAYPSQPQGYPSQPQGYPSQDYPPADYPRQGGYPQR
jgi:hypothetical protein